MAQPRFDNAALLKILLHGAKFPSCSVNGLLIGRRSDGGVHVVDAVPLLHTALTLAPQHELALAVVEERLKGSEEHLIGMYAADAHLKRDDFDAASQTIANKVATLTPSSTAVALVVENDTLGEMMDDGDVLPFKVYGRGTADGYADWSLTDFSSSGVGGIKALFQEMLEQGLHKKLHDFDEHLDDIRL